MTIYLCIDWAIEQMRQNFTMGGLSKRNIRALFHKVSLGDFPGGPVIKTPRSQCRGHRSGPWLGNYDLTCCKKKKKDLKKYAYVYIFI